MAGRYGSEATVLGVLNATGGSLTLWDLSDGSSISLSSGSLTQVGSTDAYRWCTSNITTQPTVETEYMYKMSVGSDEYYGKFVLRASEIMSSAPSAATIADAIWDEILTGASHNIATSAGRRLREASDVMVLREEETAQGGSLSSITLNAGASSMDGFYDMSTLLIVSGTGAGQARTFDDYNGTTKVGYPCEDWLVAPDNTSHYIIRGHACTAVYKMHDSVYTKIWDYIKRMIPFSF